MSVKQFGDERAWTQVLRPGEGAELYRVASRHGHAHQGKLLSAPGEAGEPGTGEHKSVRPHHLVSIIVLRNATGGIINYRLGVITTYTRG